MVAPQVPSVHQALVPGLGFGRRVRLRATARHWTPIGGLDVVNPGSTHYRDVFGHLLIDGSLRWLFRSFR